MPQSAPASARPAPAPRIVLLGFEEGDWVPALVAALEARGAQVILAPPPAPAAGREARASGAELVCALLPLPGCDAIGLCAAIKAGAASPGLLLVDPLGKAAALGDALPDELRRPTPF